MIASKKGYRNIKNFSDDSEMLSDYFGLIARGKKHYISRYINVNEGQHVLHELTAKEAAQIQKDWEVNGWTERFLERWIIGVVT